MTSYRVTFYKNLVNSNGHEFKCQQGSIDIRRARSDKRALQAAQRRYERAKKIGDWTLYADVAELDAVETDGNPPRFVEPASHA
jgi:hypothetical protein